MVMASRGAGFAEGEKGVEEEGGGALLAEAAGCWYGDSGIVEGEEGIA